MEVNLMSENKKGYEISIDKARNLLKIRVWGFWDMEVAEKYENEFKKKIKEISASGKEWYTLVDVAEYSPQSEEVQRIVSERMVFAKEHGLKKEARIVHRVTTKFQMARLARESKLPMSSEFQSENEAIQWLMSE